MLLAIQSVTSQKVRGCLALPERGLSRGPKKATEQWAKRSNHYDKELYFAIYVKAAFFAFLDLVN